MKHEKPGQGTTLKQYVKDVWPAWALVVGMILMLEYCV